MMLIVDGVISRIYICDYEAIAHINVTSLDISVPLTAQMASKFIDKQEILLFYV